MQFTAKIDYAKLSKAFEKIPIVAAKELRTELNKSLRDIQMYAKLHHRFNYVSGQLERSILQDVEESGLSGKVWLEKSIAPYGKYVHEGTPHHRIYPKNKAALYFVKGGRGIAVPKVYNKYWFIADKTNLNLTVSKKGYVDHPGTKEDPFLFIALEKKKKTFVNRIERAAKRIFDMAGL